MVQVSNPAECDNQPAIQASIENQLAPTGGIGTDRIILASELIGQVHETLNVYLTQSVAQPRFCLFDAGV